jgi:GR25 family glycosyltransferase involved in LPS biosynthesis
MQKLPQVYLINLDRSVDRLRLFKDRNRHLKGVTRVPGIEGASLDRSALISSGYILDDLKYGAGTLGSALSHIKLWEKAVAENKALTILEDAVVVSRRFEEYARHFLSNVPSDWHFIQWGTTFNSAFLWVDLGISRARIEPYGDRKYRSSSEYETFQTQKFPNAPSPLKVLHSFGIMGYSISPSGAKAALDYCLPLRQRLISFPDARVSTPDTSLDVALAGLYLSINAYTCVPHLIIRCLDEPSVRSATDKPIR